MKKTQTKKVLEWMRTVGPITPMEAMIELGIMRLSARIYDLEEQGYVIEREKISVPTRDGKATVCKYWIED